MSVYIKNMKMPKSCLVCYCTDSEYGECVLDPEKRFPEDYSKRADWCPLIPVPDHGDLIDRQAFRLEMDKHYPFDKATQSRHGIEDNLKSAVLRMLFDAPTIIPASGGTNNE